MEEQKEQEQKVIVTVGLLNQALGLLGEGVYTLPFKQVNSVIQQIQEGAIKGIEEYKQLTTPQEEIVE